MRHARLALRRYREERREAVRQLVGAHWSEESNPKKVIVNLLAMYVNIVGRSLISNNPRVSFSTFDRSLKPTVATMESWANHEIERQHIGNSLKRIVLDALFSVGIAKVCLGTPADAAMYGWQQKAGQAILSRVDLDDFVFDVHARDFNEVGWIGHRYRAPLEVIREDSRFSKERKNLSATSDAFYNREGDERIYKMGRGTLAGDSEEFEDFVDLWEVYVPRHRLVYTVADYDLAGPGGSGANAFSEPLLVQRWLGPETGPYSVLAYGTVPGNAMPKAPIQDLVDLHELVNNLYRKLARQAERQKEVVFAKGSASEDGNRLIETSDGEACKVDNPENLKQVSWGGPNQQNFAMFMNGKDLFSWLAGNLDIMGGLSPQSKTATQDAMLNTNSTRTIADMQDRTVTFTSHVLRNLCWYWWHDPFKVMSSTYSVPSVPEIQVLREIRPQDRERGSFTDLDIRVDPYSLQHQTPQQRMQGLTQVMTQIVMPMMPLLQQQGISVDMHAYLDKMAKYMDMPDLSEILTIREPPAEVSTQGQSPQMPQSTTREYVRHNMPGRTEKGDTQNLVNTLMGVNTGGAQRNGTPQPAGVQ